MLHIFKFMTENLIWLKFTTVFIISLHSFIFPFFFYIQLNLKILKFHEKVMII